MAGPGRGSRRRSRLNTASPSSAADGATALRKTAWTLSDRRAVKRRLVAIIHRFYLDAISRLPPADLRATSGLARGLLVGGHCLGPLDPVHNIIVNSVWYAAAFPLRRPANTGDDETDGRDEEAHAPLLSTDGIARICHRSVDGLVAALLHLCGPSLTTGEALWKLLSAGADLTAAAALAKGTSKSSAVRDIASEGLVAFHLAAEAARHPNPAAFAQFVSSELPAVDVQHNVVRLLIMKQVLATRHINYLSDVLVPSSRHEPSQSPPLLSPKVLGRIASEKKQFQDIRKQVTSAVNMAMQQYASQSGEQLTLHSVCGVSLLKEEDEEGLNNCYHINFLAYHTVSGSAVGAPVLFFTEAVVPSCDETDIRLCVSVDLVTDIGMPSDPSFLRV
ncbi:hypothetical protein HU200_025687 [Digitaria exilis]|uniref:Uncharacterized protein n=1 Tax=Digitaria exilis TaxID=1010633 RepID=A0A835C512_9POAL|nr:hypothetical protein HU200_025687 [Digitaria exilis]CAB3496914.1 unnamed protein product [Digitaria exilis]